jgi:DNA-binding NarL/FixJ family response regulator
VSMGDIEGRKHRIAVVEDHPLVRAGFVDMIGSEPDLEVVGEAGDAPSALGLLESARPDLMVIDLVLAKGSGLELIKQIHALNPDQKILVSSMHADTVYAERVLQAGAMGYVNKHEPAERVLSAIRTILDGQIYLSESMTDAVLHALRDDDQLKREPHALDTLSDRELEVFGLIGKGLTTRAIADRLQLSVKTIDSHREHIKEKLGLRTMNELIRSAVGWVHGAGSAR